MHLTFENNILIIDDQWFLSHYQGLAKDVKGIIHDKKKYDVLTINSTIKFDSYGLYLIHQLIHYSNSIKAKINCPHALTEQLSKIDYNILESNTGKKISDNLFATIGHNIAEIPAVWINGLNFLGYFLYQCWMCINGCEKFRYKTLMNVIEEAGIKALGIIGLVAFLLGIVLVYQGVNQLLRFGAQIYTINLLAISILRELGVLITAIIVAGRSGSAFTAELGFMKLNNEIDALTVMGINPFNLLILPRIIGLMIVMPLLVIFCDFVGLIGGGLLSTILIDVSWSQYWQQLKMAVTSWTVWSGLIKAPLCGLIIGAISCYEGFAVSGGSEDVGRRTTKSVVRSIFVVIILDAIFSVIYAKLGV